MSLFSKLFGGGSAKRSEPAPEVEPEIYAEFRIYPEPVKESGGYRLAARIEKEIDGETRSHKLVRADVFNSQDTAREASVAKAKLFIDQVGDGVFR